MSERIEALARKIDARLAGHLQRAPSLDGELAYDVEAPALLDVARDLRDSPELHFDMLIDVAGVDYLLYGQSEWQGYPATATGFGRGVMRDDAPATGESGRRFGVTYHLLSITHNERLRLRTRCASSEEPMVDSVVSVWPAADWFEREAFDLFGIMFQGHPDLRRILTDYGFIGHPFRKDFPLIGNVEVRYDAEKRRVVYEPVSIVPRVQVPRIIREDNRSDPELARRRPGEMSR
ncbi:MAG: NADH-quinone oxidoreductase subunit C [Gammaproteobacteria bacterium]|nr:NADH-quinone oxidoreductase subunit C [Gammaproteobacteria bacterium]